jgi:ABC-2 type transport system ATP-binding protein
MLLTIDDLCKVYRGRVRANDGISLSVDAGEVFGLLGHNGAGKTTLLNQVIGLSRPTSGAIRIDGCDPVADPDTARRMCSLQPQAQAPLDGITPRQAIRLMARIRGAGRRRARARADELLAALDLEPWADTVGQKLSGGVLRLTAFCMAAAEPGRLVMFDEPTNDVDPVRRRLLWQQVRALGEAGCAVVLVTHNVVEAERAVQRLVILDQGRVVAQGSPAELRGEHADRLRIELVAADPQAAARVAGEAVGVEPAVVAGQRVSFPIEPASATTALAWVQQHRTAGLVDEFSVTPVSLEDVYITLVGRTERGGPIEPEVESAPLAA